MILRKVCLLSGLVEPFESSNGALAKQISVVYSRNKIQSSQRSCIHRKYEKRVPLVVENKNSLFIFRKKQEDEDRIPAFVLKSKEKKHGKKTKREKKARG